MRAFIYHWFVDDEFNKEGEKELVIRAYGITPEQETVVLHIKDFRPWFFLELTKNQQTCCDWTPIRNMVESKLSDRCKHLKNNRFYLVHKKKLYFDQQQSEFPLLKLRFNNIQTRKSAYYSLQRYFCKTMGQTFEVFCHEHEATPLLQLIVSKNLPTAGWIEFKGFVTNAEEKISAKKEYNVLYKDLEPLAPEKEMQLGYARPTVLSFDLEVYSSNPNRMPCAENPKDVIFQISAVAEGSDKKMKKILLTLGKTTKNAVGSDVQVRHFVDEKELLLGFTSMVRELDPHILIGYNIFGFDIPYMVARAKMHDVLDQFNVLGVPLHKHAPEKEIKWSSSAYSYQEFHYLDTEGRIFVDLLPVVKRDYKFSNYKLKTVSTFFLGETKDPLTAKDIFAAYEEGITLTKEGIRKMSECGKYCIQDSALVLKLFGVLQLWIGLSEMAKICKVPIMYLFTKGQQIKVFSQVYKKCYDENILVQSIQDHPVLESCNGYAGAYVFPPDPGIYDWVIPFDFSSLYPTTIIAYNIDYSTLVLDESTVDLKDCHVIEWEDHVNCEHDVTPKSAGSSKAKRLCGKNRFVFRKNPIGVIPSLLKTLLQQRSETKKLMKTMGKASLDKEMYETQMTVLDKRQLAYKLSANSMYGAMGVRKGYLPFMPGAMSTTAMGRMSIQKAAEYVKAKHDGQLIYGDTDSIYCHFKGHVGAKNSWDMAKRVEEELLKLFPSPMKLVFEEKVYQKFLILTKKRYMAYTCDDSGKIDEKLTIRGVLLARRDNCKWIRDLYEKVVRSLMDGDTREHVLEMIQEHVLDLLRWKNNKNALFIVSKLVSKDYKVKALPTDVKKCKKRLEELGIYPSVALEEKQIIEANAHLEDPVYLKKHPWMDAYLNKIKPAHVQLAHKMTLRGKPVEAGTRIEYLIIHHVDDPKAKLYDKLEDPSYFTSHRDILRMDRLYYIHSLAKPMDQLLQVVYRMKNFVAGLYDVHSYHFKMCEEIKKRQAPIILYDEEVYKPPKRKALPKMKKVQIGSSATTVTKIQKKKNDTL